MTDNEKELLKNFSIWGYDSSTYLYYLVQHEYIEDFFDINDGTFAFKKHNCDLTEVRKKITPDQIIADKERYLHVRVYFPADCYYEIYINKDNDGFNRVRVYPTDAEVQVTDERTLMLLDKGNQEAIIQSLKLFGVLNKKLQIFENTVLALMKPLMDKYGIVFSIAYRDSLWETAIEKDCILFKYRLKGERRYKTVLIPMENFLPVVNDIKSRIVEELEEKVCNESKNQII